MFIIPFILMIIELSIRDYKHYGYCDTLYDTYPIPINFLLIIGIIFILMGVGNLNI